MQNLEGDLQELNKMSSSNFINYEDVCNIHDLILILNKTVRKVNEVEIQLKEQNDENDYENKSNKLHDHDINKNNKTKQIEIQTNVKSKINKYKIHGRL